MSNIIPFSGNNFPSHFASDEASFKLNAAAEEFSSVKFPVITAKNGRFFEKRDGEKALILRLKTNANEPDEPASYLDMTVLNIQKAKTFYAEGYTEGSVEAPDCFSNDGITPDSSAKDPQCATCALCAHNAWGSGVNEKGEATKGKACSDVQRLAIASPANLDDPFMLRVPPASLKNFAEVGKFLTSKRVPLNGAVIRFSFDATKTGVLNFEAIGGLDAATYAAAKAKMDDPLVLAIVGKPVGSGSAPVLSVVKVATPKAATPVVDPAVAAAAATASAALARLEAKAAKLAAAQAALAAAQADDEDDEALVVEAAAPVEVKPKAKTKAPVATSSTFDDELAALLG